MINFLPPPKRILQISKKKSSAALQGADCFSPPESLRNREACRLAVSVALKS